MYELIHADRGNIPVARACRVLRVSRSGYYQWLHAEPSARAIDDGLLAAEIKEVFYEHQGCYHPLNHSLLETVRVLPLLHGPSSRPPPGSFC